MDEEAKAQGWERSQLTLSLSAARLAQLRVLAANMEPGASPTDAVVRAISMAADQVGESPWATRLDALEDELNAMSMDGKLDTERIEAAILALAKNLGELHALISAVASQESDGY